MTVKKFFLNLLLLEASLFALTTSKVSLSTEGESAEMSLNLLMSNVHLQTYAVVFDTREVLQSEIRMQIFVKLGLRTHESSDGPANRRVVLQTEN